MVEAFDYSLMKSGKGSGPGLSGNWEGEAVLGGGCRGGRERVLGWAVGWKEAEGQL